MPSTTETQSVSSQNSHCSTVKDVSFEIIGAAIEVHKVMGPGLLESVYEDCLEYELIQRKLSFQRQVSIPINYKGEILHYKYRIDFIVEDCIVLELKSVDYLIKIHEAQLITYLKLTKKKIGLLINFNSLCLKDGIKRLIL